MKKIEKEKLKVGFYGVSGCAGCLLTVLFEECFKEIIELVDVKNFPLIKEDSYNGKLDYVFVEGTVCFDKDIEMVKKLRKRAKRLVAFGSCACTGGVPSIKNFLDSEKALKLVYPVHNKLNPVPPAPIHDHVDVDYYLPQCPPDKDEIIEFLRCIVGGREFVSYRDPVCVECRLKGNLCLLTKGEICLGPITNGGCKAICPTNNTTCYGCRGPCNDANMEAFIDLLKNMGYKDKMIHSKMNTFAGLQFKEKEGGRSKWLEK